MITNLPGTPMMRALAAGITANVPTLLWGAPGQGKTAIIEALGEALGRHTETVIGSVREPADFLGLPMEENGQVFYAPPGFAKRLAEAVKGLLLLDELSTSSPSVQKAMLRLAQERYAGDQHLGKNTAIVAAANPPECGVDAMDLPAPVANRFMHLDWHFDADVWLANLATGFDHVDFPEFDKMLGEGGHDGYVRAAGAIAGFLKFRPDLLVPKVPEDPEEQGKAWASPRSWHNFAKVLGVLHRDDDAAALLVGKGLVGSGPATEFFAWLREADLIEPAEVMKNPDLVDWTGRPDRLFATINAVQSLATLRGDEKSWHQALNVMVTCAVTGNRADVAFPSVRHLVNNRPEGVNSLPPEVKAAFSDLMVRTGRFASQPAA